MPGAKSQVRCPGQPSGFPLGPSASLCSSVSYLLHFEKERIHKVPRRVGIQGSLVLFHLLGDKGLDGEQVFEVGLMIARQVVHDAGKEAVELKRGGWRWLRDVIGSSSMGFCIHVNKNY